MPSKRLIKDPVKYKTVLCTTWATTGQCPYNRKCQFAHGKEELRQRAVPSPPQPPQPQPGQMPPPMMLPLTSGMAGSSSAVGLRVPASSAMGSWPAAPPSAAPPLPLGLPLSSNAAAQTSLPGMPPLPPGPPPSSVLPLPSGPSPSSVLPQGALAAPSGLRSLPPALPMQAMRPLSGVELPTVAEMAVPTQEIWAAPSMAAPLAAKPPSLSADELSCFAMRCHLADDDSESKPSDNAESSCDLLGKSEFSWAPLRCNEVTGKVEVQSRSPFSVDSPVEPTLGKVGRQVSYPTQVVRRAISFVFDDGPNSPVNARRNTAMAA